jgi:hypothetical protein
MITTNNPWVLSLPADKVEAWIEKNGERACEEHMTTDPVFALWLVYVDKAVMRRAWISYRDLEDWDYWSAYDAGMSPKDAAIDMLDANGYDMDEEG